VRNQAAPEVQVRKTAQKFSGAPAQAHVLHERVERAEGHLVHKCIYQYLYVLVCIVQIIKNALNTMSELTEVYCFY
jgi:hypothetical protein